MIKKISELGAVDVRLAGMRREREHNLRAMQRHPEWLTSFDHRWVCAMCDLVEKGSQLSLDQIRAYGRIFEKLERQYPNWEELDAEEG